MQKIMSTTVLLVLMTSASAFAMRIDSRLMCGVVLKIDETKSPGNIDVVISTGRQHESFHIARGDIDSIKVVRYLEYIQASLKNDSYICAEVQIVDMGKAWADLVRPSSGEETQYNNDTISLERMMGFQHM